MDELEKLRDELRAFADARDWNQFHSPKNLAMALAAESGELLEIFQWLTEEQSRRLDSKAAGQGDRRGRGCPPVPGAPGRPSSASTPPPPARQKARRERPQVPRGEGARHRHEVHRALVAEPAVVHWSEGGETRSARVALRARRAAAEEDRRRRRPHDRRQRLRPRGPGRGHPVARRLPERAAAPERDRRPHRSPPWAKKPSLSFRERAGERANHRPTSSTPCAKPDPKGPHARHAADPTRSRLLHPLRRAPDIREACTEAYGPAQGASLVSLRELLGVIGAHEWRRNGIEVPAIGARIHALRHLRADPQQYVDLVAKAPLPAAIASNSLAFDIGTGTGVLAAVLARRGIERVVATDRDPRALACARDNFERLGLSGKVEVVEADLFPEARAPLVVCNPPWVPARPSSPLEHGIYDPDSRMLKGFLQGSARTSRPAARAGSSSPTSPSTSAAHAGGAARIDERRRLEGHRPVRCKAGASASHRRKRPAPPSAQGGSNVPLAAFR